MLVVFQVSGAAQALRRRGVSQSTVRRRLRQQLGLFPYKLQLIQQTKHGDKAKRLRFCRWLLDRWKSPCFRRNVLFSDEAHFHLNGVVISRTARCEGLRIPTLPWSEQHPRYLTA